MPSYRVRDAPKRWGALEPVARRRLILHLTRLLAIIIVLYAVSALFDHSWWRPAVVMAAVAAATKVVGLFRRVSR
jgi:hypothetical protein